MEQKAIGRFLTDLRREKAMTQKEVAEKLHVSDRTVSRWERGENCPDISLLPTLAELFGVSVEELLKGERMTRGTVEERKESGEEAERADTLLRGTQAMFRSYLWVCVGLLIAGILTLPLYLLGVILIVAAIVLLFVQYGKAKNQVLYSTVALEERRKKAFLAQISTSLWQVIGSLLAVPFQMGLAALGNQILNYTYNIQQEAVSIPRYLLSVFVIVFLGSDFSFGILPRALVVIVLLNIGLRYRYRKKSADILYPDERDRAAIRKLAKKAKIAAVICISSLMALHYVFVQVSDFIYQKQLEESCFIIEFTQEDQAAFDRMLTEKEPLEKAPAPSEALREKKLPVYAYRDLELDYDDYIKTESAEGTLSRDGYRYGILAAERERLRAYAYDYTAAGDLQKLSSLWNVVVYPLFYPVSVLAVYLVYNKKRKNVTSRVCSA